MRMTTTLAAAAAIAVSGIAANAGGLTLAPQENDVMVVPMAVPAGSSIGGGYIVLGLLAALVAASGSF